MKYENGEIKIDAWELIQYLPEEKLLEFIETFSCHDAVIKHVTDQIIERWTENMCSGGNFYPMPAEPTTGLDWAWREVSKRSGEVAKTEIENLEKSIMYRDGELKKLRDENYQLRESNQKLRNLI
jgi:hypothetical protein